MMGPEVLVVDDDLADLLADIFGSAGYRVRTVADGGSALAELARAAPDLVVTDVSHPGPDGYAVVAACRERPDPIAVLLTSAWRVPACPAGAVCLAKPFDVDELLAVVARMLGRDAT